MQIREKKWKESFHGADEEKRKPPRKTTNPEVRMPARKEDPRTNGNANNIDLYSKVNSERSTSTRRESYNLCKTPTCYRWSRTALATKKRQKKNEHMKRTTQAICQYESTGWDAKEIKHQQSATQSALGKKLHTRRRHAVRENITDARWDAAQYDPNWLVHIVQMHHLLL
jgi:hypothetical protein